MGAAFVLALVPAVAASSAAISVENESLLSSPSGHISLQFTLDTEGIARYSVRLDGHTALLPSRLSLVREDADFSRRLVLVSRSPVEQITDQYTLLTGLAELPVAGTATLITDGEGGNLSFREQTVRVAADKTLDIRLKPRGGFVLVFD